jgi:phospholipid N-methyltransferase
MMTATYSPEDNKLRLYSVSRLDAETYARVRAAGFIYAPKQELFVAPMWTPQREDLLIDLCGEIGDEDTSLVDRAEQRSERFENYSDKRAADADRARKAVAAIADNIPFGQPILVGHHSERHARKDAERIENGMRKAVQMWATSNYWVSRAAGAIHHAKYKERPDVRARRIKTIEADKRKCERNLAQSQKTISIWETLETSPDFKKKDGGEVTFIERAMFICDNTRHGGAWEIGSELRKGTTTPEQARERILAGARHCATINERWINHSENRLAYERAMLAESGWTAPPKPKTKAELPLLNYSGTVTYRNPWRHGETITSEAVPITKEQWAKIGTDYKGTRVSGCGTHRVRTAMHIPGHGHDLCIVFITDSKQHARPDADTVAAKEAEESAAALLRAEAKRDREITRMEAREAAQVANADRAAKNEEFRAIKEAVKAGVQVVTAPQLFPTPAALAVRMVELADLRPGLRILEPSAGTGAIADAIRSAEPDAYLVCNEINPQLVKVLDAKGHRTTCEDFLTYTAPPFDFVLMNPPFANAADVAHIRHALTLLAPGGRLVAICANGPRQRAILLPLVEENGGTWEDLPPGTFESSGTGVNTALLCIDSPEAEPEQPTALQVESLISQAPEATTDQSKRPQLSLFG